MFRKGKFILDDEAKDAYIAQIEEHGRAASAAKHLGTTMSVINQAIRDDKEFAEACNDALLVFKDRIDEEIYRRAIIGVEEPVFYKGVAGDTRIVRSDSLLQFMAKGNIDKYQDRKKHDVNITGGVLLTAPPRETEAWLEDHKPEHVLPEAESVVDVEEED